MDVGTLLISMASMGGLGALFSGGLALANKKLHVEEDPRISEIQDWLPGANCGGCGYPGCANFAEKVVLQETTVGGCPVCNDEAREEIARFMGLEAEAGEKLVARIMCQGGEYETAKKGVYFGAETCTAAAITSGGEKMCAYGCLGFGECVDACPFDALHLDANGLPVVDQENCTGCANCIDACPRGVIEMHPVSDRLFVACRNEDGPKESRKLCIKACVGCSICVRALADGEMTIENNLARIDYGKYGQGNELPTEKCPTDCLIVIEPESVVV